MSDLDLILDRINFDPKAPTVLHDEAPGGVPFIDGVYASAVHAEPIPWPEGLAPTPVKPTVTGADPLPKCDVLIVTYTTAEGQALADTLTPGIESSEWLKYTNGWEAIKALIEGHRAPSLESERASIWWQTRIGDKNVIVMKSDLHPATDGPNVPIVTAWKQWIAQCQPSLVITTGTAGGVGASVELGDVVVAVNVRWNCQKQFDKKPWAHASYACTASTESPYLDTAVHTLLPINAGKIPSDYRPLPLGIIEGHDIESTDFFAFDTSDDHYGLRAYDPACAAVEMDDAALGLALSEMTAPPRWAAVRNASDPGNLTGANLEAENKLAAGIYQKYGYYTTIGSAITCWALVAGL